jgi:hypothetical protein
MQKRKNCLKGSIRPGAKYAIKLATWNVVFQITKIKKGVGPWILKVSVQFVKRNANGTITSMSNFI